MTYDEKIKESKEQAAKFVPKAEALLEKLKNDPSNPNDIKEGEQLLADLAKIRKALQTGFEALKNATESLSTREKSGPIHQRWEKETSSDSNSAESVDRRIVRIHTALKVKLLELTVESQKTTNANLQSQLGSQATLLEQLQEQMKALQNSMILSNAAQQPSASINALASSSAIPSSIALAPTESTFSPPQQPQHVQISATTSATSPTVGTSYTVPIAQQPTSSFLQPMFASAPQQAVMIPQMACPSFMQWSQQIKLDIEKFDGTPSRFLTFWQQFEAIHSDPSIPTLKKLLLLREYTTGSVKRTLDLYTPIAQNYDCMIKLLHDEYGSNQKAIVDLFSVMNRLPTRAQHGNTLETMGELQSILNQLEAHGENIDHCAYYSIFMDRLPKEVFTRISYMGGIPDTMVELRKKAYEAYKNIRIEKQHDARLVGSNHVNECSSSKPAYRAASHSSHDKCVFCDKHPSKYDCRTVTDASERKDILIKSGRCLYCFSDDHQSNHCYDRPTCSKCGNLHNSFLCNAGTSKRPESPKKEKPTTVACAVQPKSDKSTSASNVLLITANTKVQNPETKASRKAIIFIDTGSEASFIHRKLARQLRLKPECQVTLNIKPFEAAEMSLEIMQTTVRLRLADGTWKPLKVYIVDNLIGKVKRADNDDKALPSIREETPDILIGMDQLAEVSKLHMQLDNATGKPFFETSFGNVLAGPRNQSTGSAARSTKVNSSTVTKNDQPQRASNIFKVDNTAVPAPINYVTFDDYKTRQEADSPVQSDDNYIKDDKPSAVTRLRQQSNDLITYDVMATPLKDSVTKQVVNSEETTNNEVTVDSAPFTTVSRHLDPANCLQPANFCDSVTKSGNSTIVKEAIDDKNKVPSEAEPSSSSSSRRREALLPKASPPDPSKTSYHHPTPTSWQSSSFNTGQLRHLRAYISRRLQASNKFRKRQSRRKFTHQNPMFKCPTNQHPPRKRYLSNLQLRHRSPPKNPVRQPKRPTVHRHVRDHPDNHAHLKMKSSLRWECRNAAALQRSLHYVPIFTLCPRLLTIKPLHMYLTRGHLPKHPAHKL